MSATPYISFVAASRNDDHGGNLRHRMQVFVEALLAQCDRHRLHAELVLVEWNPPADRPRLDRALSWPRSALCPVRILEVAAGLHRRFDNAESLPLHQFIAKNAGIRRARGAFVAATNIDVVLSDPLAAFLAKGELDADRFYRADRHDVDADVPAGAPLDRQLAYCERHRLRVHRRDGTVDLGTGRFDRIHRHPALLRAVRLLAPLAFVPGLGRRLDNAKRSLAFIEACGRLHTNASGDFTLMARRHWHALEGYWEFAGFPLNVDGVLCHAAHFSGLEERRLPEPMRVYHVEHGRGSGFAGYASGERQKALEQGGIARLTTEAYAGLLFDMKAGRRPLELNGGRWGLGDTILPERTP